MTPSSPHPRGATPADRLSFVRRFGSPFTTSLPFEEVPWACGSISPWETIVAEHYVAL